MFTNKRSIPVLMYHHVRPGAGMIACTPEHFESQLQWLKDNDYASLTLDEFAQHLAGQEVLKIHGKSKAVLITFDDGYLNNWVYAFPLLEKYGFKAAIFLVTSWLHHGEIRSNTKMAAELPDCPDHHECEALIAKGRSDGVILRWEEVKAMQASGLIEFHSHTHTHTRWDKIDAINKNQQMQWELETSKQTLHQKLGLVSPHLCWPQGYFDDDYVRLAQRLGYNYLYTTNAFGRNTSSTSPLFIHRFAVRNRPGKTLGKRILASHHLLIAPIFNSFKAWRHRHKK